MGEWKSFVCRNFIAGNNKICPVLEKAPLQNIPRTVNLYLHKSLSEQLKQIPPEMKELISSIDLPQDNGKSLICAIMKGKALGASNLSQE